MPVATMTTRAATSHGRAWRASRETDWPVRPMPEHAQVDHEQRAAQETEAQKVDGFQDGKGPHRIGDGLADRRRFAPAEERFEHGDVPIP